jgi:hypothetical protein
VSLSTAYREHFPGSSYKAAHAKRKLKGMPIVILNITTSNVSSENVVIPYEPGINYESVLMLVERLLPPNVNPNAAITKEKLKALLEMSTTRADRQILLYGIAKAGGMSASRVRAAYGIENFNHKATRVEDALEQMVQIQEACYQLAQIRFEAELEAAGLPAVDLLDEDDDDTDLDEGSEKCLSDGLNFWSEGVEVGIENQTVISVEATNIVRIPDNASDGINDVENNNNVREDVLETVSDDIDEIPDMDWTEVTTMDDLQFELNVEKMKRRLRERAQREILHHKAEERFLKRKIGVRTKRIIQRHPDIGAVMEKLCSDAGLGANKWRSTSSITMSTNVSVNKGMTYLRLVELLRKYYKDDNISYGTVVELCVPRNCHRSCAKRYAGVANIVTRRTRKGWEERVNIDRHWSRALYRGLDYLQYQDDSEFELFNRDDAAAFKLDTCATSRHRPTPMLRFDVDLTPRTDYSEGKNTIQVSTYNFTKTGTRSELAAGMVKAPRIHPKCPATHMADLEKIRKHPHFKPVFHKGPNWQYEKPGVCVRLDRGSDENLTFMEVKFLWTEYTVRHSKTFLLLTSRAAGDSYLNRAELQNGQYGLSNANTFIPSQVLMSNKNRETGKEEKWRVQANLEKAIEIYIKRNEALVFNRTEVKFLTIDTKLQEKYTLRRDRLKNFLTKINMSHKSYSKWKASQDHPEEIKEWEDIMNIMKRHEHYQQCPHVFYLGCCFIPECPHPVCKAADGSLPLWYPTGPAVSTILWPMRDNEVSGENCKSGECQNIGHCYGHYMQPEQILQTNVTYKAEDMLPPSKILDREFAQDIKAGTFPSERRIEELAHLVCLTIDEIKYYFNHVCEKAAHYAHGQKVARENRSHKLTKPGEHQERVDITNAILKVPVNLSDYQ